MKKCILFILCSMTCLGAMAQNSSGAAQQTVQLGMNNAMDISFTGSGTAQGSTVSLAFNDASSYANGVESAPQELKIRSNKNFKVSVKIDLTNFSYTGNGNLYTAVIPSDIFQVKLPTNATNGTVAAPFSANSYANIGTTDQDLILNGLNGNDQRFSVKYKCNPGWGMPAGTYVFDVVYTATQQ